MKPLNILRLSLYIHTLIVSVSIISTSNTFAEEAFKAPKIWDSEKLSDWGLPRAYARIHENYISEDQYYNSPGFNTRTYPVYHPEKEPEGYWEWLHTLDPLPLVEPGQARTREEWIRIGRDVFDQMDQVGFRTDDPVAFEFLRDPEKFMEEDVSVAGDGTIPKFRWVVEGKGIIKLGLADCAECHLRLMPDGLRIRGAPGNQKFGGAAMVSLLATGEKQFKGPRVSNMTDGEKRHVDFGVPWIKDDVHKKLKAMSSGEVNQILSSGVPGTLARIDGSPYWITKIPDLRGIKNRYFLDATATHLNREPADISRYGAHVMYAGVNSFGKYEMLPEDAPRPLYHVEDDVLFALGMFISSLLTAENPVKNQLNPVLVARGREVFIEEDCMRCHKEPDYTDNKLMAVEGFVVPNNHPFKDFIRRGKIDTDPGLALKTRKGTGLYKIPSLRGVWYRGLFGHDGSVKSLEDWFDPKRLEEDYIPTGWKGPGVEKRSVPGHEYGLDLSNADKTALITFLMTL